MSWRDERTTIRRGRLVSLVFASGLAIAMLGLSLGIIVTAVVAEAPPELLIALLAVFVLRLLVSLFETVNFYIRRRARRRRMRGL